jgi:hypothetical protein
MSRWSNNTSVNTDSNNAVTSRRRTLRPIVTQNSARGRFHSPTNNNGNNRSNTTPISKYMGLNARSPVMSFEQVINTLAHHVTSWKQRQKLLEQVGKQLKYAEAMSIPVLEGLDNVRRWFARENTVTRPLLLCAHGEIDRDDMFRVPPGLKLVFMTVAGSFYYTSLIDFRDWDVIHSMLTSNAASVRPLVDLDLRIPVHTYTEGQLVSDMLLDFTPDNDLTGIHVLPLMYQNFVTAKSTPWDPLVKAKTLAANHVTLLWDPRDDSNRMRLPRDGRMRLKALANFVAKAYGPCTLFVSACRACKLTSQATRYKHYRHNVNTQRARGAINLFNESAVNQAPGQSMATTPRRFCKLFGLAQNRRVNSTCERATRLWARRLKQSENAMRVQPAIGERYKFLHKMKTQLKLNSSPLQQSKWRRLGNRVRSSVRRITRGSKRNTAT